MTAKHGVLLINLGTPDAPTVEAIRRYLREFLSDRRVIDVPRAIWWPVLHGFILPLRPRTLVPLYRGIWRPDGSPLLAITREQRAGLEAQLARMPAGPVAVAAAMRYGAPGLAAALAALAQAGVQRLLALPLYPQRSLTTTASALDGLAAALARGAWQPELRTVEQYHLHPRYLAALTQSVRDHWSAHGRGERLLMSFHGIPRRYVEAGDPYERQCHETAQRLAAALQLAPGDWQICFQSRVGRAQWTGPYTEDVLRALARRGARRVDVICPGFAADCLETLDEIARRYAAGFVAAGGEALRYVPALNARPDHIDALAHIAAEHLA